jgi:hypothetical protein
MAVSSSEKSLEVISQKQEVFTQEILIFEPPFRARSSFGGTAARNAVFLITVSVKLIVLKHCSVAYYNNGKAITLEDLWSPYFWTWLLVCA